MDIVLSLRPNLWRDKDVLIVEPDNEKHIETIVVRCKNDKVQNNASRIITG